MNVSEKGWEKAGQILLVILLLSMAFRIGLFVGEHPKKNEQYVVESLEHALDVIDAVNVEDTDDVCMSFDTVMDDIHDALAWMEKGP